MTALELRVLWALAALTSTASDYVPGVTSSLVAIEVGRSAGVVGAALLGALRVFFPVPIAVTDLL